MNKIEQFPKPNLSDEEIDRIVESQVEDRSAWEKPIEVTQQPISIVIPATLAAKAKFLATLECKSDLQAMLIEMIQEQINIKFAVWEKSQLNSSEKAVN